jgi:pimeloyl-ACP methyl ester carboxylesterase
MAIVTLPNGRRLDIEVTGPVDGITLLFLHGTPSTVLQLRAMRQAAQVRGLRLVTYSRPGYARSTRDPGRAVASCVPDIAAVLDHVEAARCLVAGWSGGGPHALAAGAGLPDRVAGVLSVASVGPSDAPDLEFLAGMGEGNIEEFGAAARGEAVLRAALEPMAAGLAAGDAAGLLAEIGSVMSDVDRAVMPGEFGADVAAGLADAVSSGVDGWLDDDLAFLKPWGFALSDLDVPVFLWQGDEDLMVPAAHGRWLAGELPHAVPHLITGEGHLSILRNSIGTMLDELMTAL